MNILNGNIVSDSQESAIMDDETYQDIKNTFGGTLPVPDELARSLSASAKKELNGMGLEAVEDIKEEFYYSYAMKNIDTSKHFRADEKSIPFAMKKRRNDSMYLDAYDYLDYPFNFQYTIPNGKCQEWEYSETLKKVYVKMETTLPMRFTWEQPARMPGLFLRTQLAFVYEQHKNDPVKRCPNHVAMTDHNQMEPGRIKHVVQCTNHISHYQEEDEHLSILTPLCNSEDSSQCMPMCYKFFCKNSCTSGMNRRETELIFTLEDEKKRILGRQTLGIRICSCPKRDIKKVEKSLKPPVNEKSTKSCDTHVYKVELNIVGKENYISVHKYAYDLMAGQAARTGLHERYQSHMDDISQKVLF